MNEILRLLGFQAAQSYKVDTPALYRYILTSVEAGVSTEEIVRGATAYETDPDILSSVDLAADYLRLEIQRAGLRTDLEC